MTALVYGVPKLARGLALDDKPTDEVKADQKEFFGLLYRLLVDAERGPRLPTLIVALGADRVRALLGRLAAGGSSAAAGLESRRNDEQRSHSSVSPIARADSASRARLRRKPRLGSCSHGTGPWPFHPLRRSRSRLRW